MRVVSLLASATEMIHELGCSALLVGRSHECDYPAQVLSLPVVSKVQIDTTTSSANIDAQIKQLARLAVEPPDPALKALSIYAIDIDQLQALRPDIIFTQTQCEVCAVSERDVVQAIEHLTGFQPRVVSLAPRQLADVWQDVLRVGAALGRSSEAERLVNSYKRRLQSLLETTSSFTARPRVSVLEWLDPLMGSGNWTPELVRYAGAQNVFGEVGLHSPWLSWEALQAEDPDILVLSPCGYSIERTMVDVPLLRQNPVWSTLRAVRSGRVYAIDGNQYLNRSGPRLVESAELLATVVWGERSGVKVDPRGWRHIP
jgi:iron complex transport system substrate-binding protein